MPKKLPFFLVCFIVLAACSKSGVNSYVGISDVEYASLITDDVLFVASSKKMYIFRVSDSKILRTFDKPKGFVDTSICVSQTCYWAGGFHGIGNIGSFDKTSETFSEVSRKEGLDLGRFYSILYDNISEQLIGLHSTGRVSFISKSDLGLLDSFYVSKSELYVGILDGKNRHLYVGDGSGMITNIDLNSREVVESSVKLGSAITGIFKYDDDHVVVSTTGKQIFLVNKADFSEKTLLAEVHSPATICHRPVSNKVIICGLANGSVVSINEHGKRDKLLDINVPVVFIHSTTTRILVLGKNGELRKAAPL